MLSASVSVDLLAARAGAERVYRRRCSPPDAPSRTSRSWCSRSTRGGARRSRRSKRRSWRRRARWSCTCRCAADRDAGDDGRLKPHARSWRTRARRDVLQHRWTAGRWTGRRRPAAGAGPDARGRGIVHGRAAAVAVDRRAWQLRLRGGRRRRLQNDLKTSSCSASEATLLDSTARSANRSPPRWLTACASGPAPMWRWHYRHRRSRRRVA